ncbi:MAG TPA: Asp-tRNA(Asn)/Glu-tRNA(Gln) amidotransferase subunit GatC [Spirochaetia bacterium]|nr:Asp-tRNA(Asn)/Glu-tRNA(Gln) amidotransferase subunit GatC [Spirochaetia bacterium]
MSGQIDDRTIRHIASLSRIELKEEEIPSLARQLSSILEYFDKLAELDTSAVEPMTHAIELSNVLAEDSPSTSLETRRALANAPDHDGSFFKVPKVLGDS